MELLLAHDDGDTLVLRDPGYYRVRQFGTSNMIVGEWTGRHWLIPGSALSLEDDDFSVIAQLCE